jgi:4-amino-4-deoxy-L-arabinose transferase-like glycosyltransferase
MQGYWTGFRRFSEKGHALWLVLALTLATRLALILILPQEPFSDGAYYLDRARDLITLHAYQEAGLPTAFWPPGQSFLYAGAMMLFGPGLAGPLIVNLLSAMLIAWLVVWFGTHVGHNRAGGILAGLIYALYPAHIAYTGTVLSETASTAISMAAIALLLGGRQRLLWVYVAGLLFGFATLIRAQMLYFPVGMLIAMAVLVPGFGWARAIRCGLVVCVAAFTIVMPWSLRNQAQLDEFVLVSTNGGVALYTGAHDGATCDHIAWDKPMWERSGIPFDERIARQLEVDRNLKRQASDWIKANPGRWIAMMPKKAAILWVKDSDGFWGLKGSYPAQEHALTLAQWANQAWYMAILLLAIPALWFGLKGWLFRRNEAQRQLLILFLMPVFCTLTAIVFTGQIRYHYPAMPFLIAAAGWAIARWMGRDDKSASRP